MTQFQKIIIGFSQFSVARITSNSSQVSINIYYFSNKNSKTKKKTQNKKKSKIHLKNYILIKTISS